MALKRMAIVTGGARGIGRATVARFLKGGFQVAVIDVLDPVCKSKNQEYFFCDLTDMEAVRFCARQICDRYGAVDVLVNNAATGYEFIDLVDMDFDHWDRVQNTNLRGHALLSALILPGMIKRKKGVVINVSSCAAIGVEAGHTAYAASKAGLMALTKCLAREVGKYGVRIVAVVPGWIATENNKPTEADNEWLACNISLGRAGEPKEVAEVIYFLAGASASYISGQSIIVDGGEI